MKLTRWCKFPWSFIQVHAGGMMQCCGVAADTDIGDFLLDYCEKNEDERDPLNNEGLRMMREGLLTGNLRPMCRNCYFSSKELITTEEFRKRLIAYLSSKKPDEDFEHADLTKVYALDWVGLSFTNKCNLSCIYCTQSTMKNTNPYFKMDYPYEYAEETLEFFTRGEKIDVFRTCVEGEATLYPHWYEVFSKFHEKHPEIRMVMTTNFNRKFSEEEIDLLSQYYQLDISVESIDPKIYSFFRRNGNLELVLKNVDAVIAHCKNIGRKQPRITFHTVITDKSWSSLRALADYAYARGIGLALGNYEVRPNTVATKENLIQPVSELPYETQKEIAKILDDIQRDATERGIWGIVQGDIFANLQKQVDQDYNTFQPYDNRELIKKFHAQNPKGQPGVYLDIAYDTDCISHEGIRIAKGETLRVNELSTDYVIVREVEVYKKGTVSDRYDRPVKLLYRKKLPVTGGVFEYKPSYTKEDIDYIVLEVF